MFRRPIKPRSNASQNRIRRRNEDSDPNDEDKDDAVRGDDDDGTMMSPSLHAKQKMQQAKKNTKTKKRTIVTQSQTASASNLAHLQDDEEEDAIAPVLQEATTTTATSGQDDDTSPRMTHHHRSKRQRISAVPLDDTNRNEKGTDHRRTETTRTTATSSTSRYGSDSLAQLKAEQRYQKRPPTDATTTTTQTETTSVQYSTTTTRVASSISNKHEVVKDEPPPMVLAGDEALQFMQPVARNMGSTVDEDKDFYRKQQHRMDTTAVVDSPLDDAEASASWEAQLARRGAGLQGRQARHNTPSMIRTPPDIALTATRHATDNVSLQQLRHQIDTALTRLQEQQMEISRTQERRMQQVHQIEEELQRYEQDLQISGQAHEYFQQWRHRLASWVGALRDLSIKVMPLQDALYDLEAEVAAVGRWKDWEDDIASVLRENDSLDRVLGRQPAARVLDGLNNKASNVVDEFGRSAQSQFVLQREKRFRHRQRIREQRSETPRGDESDAFLSDGEGEDFRERHVALQKALEVALEELDEDFTKLQKLVNDFEKLYKAFPDEYKQCFTSLSLADLASVLIRVELCSLNDPWDESHGYNVGKWTAVVRAAREIGMLDEAATERLMEKSVLPAVSSLIEKKGINLSSKRQMKSMGEFMISTGHFLQPESKVMETLREKLVEYVRQSLDDIAIPIAKQTALVSDTDILKESLQGSTVGQMHRLKKILINLLKYWAPVLQTELEFCDAVLDFVGVKFIFLLSSLQGFDQPRFSSSPADAFREVYEVLQRMQWLERPEFILSATPIQAAATVYEVGLQF